MFKSAKNPVILAASFIALFGGVAVADTSPYNFTYAGTYFAATGTLEVNGSGVAINGTGTLTYGTTSTSMTLYEIDNPPSGVINARMAGGTDFIGLDNQLLPGSGPSLDEDGLIFWLGSAPPTNGLSQPGNIDLNPAGGFNVYYQGGYKAWGANGSGLYNSDNGTFELVSVPEPGGLLIAMLAGLGGLAGLLRHKLA